MGCSRPVQTYYRLTPLLWQGGVLTIRCTAHAGAAPFALARAAASPGRSYGVQRVVVRVRVVEQGQNESYYSPEHGEQKSHGDDGVEARPWGVAGVGGLPMCHNVPHGRHDPRAAAFYAAPACGSMSRCTGLTGWSMAAMLQQLPAARAKMSVSVVL